MVSSPWIFGTKHQTLYIAKSCKLALVYSLNIYKVAFCTRLMIISTEAIDESEFHSYTVKLALSWKNLLRLCAVVLVGPVSWRCLLRISLFATYRYVFYKVLDTKRDLIHNITDAHACRSYSLLSDDEIEIVRQSNIEWNSLHITTWV